jgi:hypothetical protein
MATELYSKETYQKRKYVYLLELSQMPHRLVFQNVKAGVDYINRLGLFKDHQICDYGHVIRLLRSGQNWNNLSTGLTLKLSQILVYGQKVKSVRKVPLVAAVVKNPRSARVK